MAVYSTIWMPSLSCNVYFDSVRELELVADVHEHLVTRGSFEAVVLVIGVADDVLLQVLDQLPDLCLSLYCQETENVEKPQNCPHLLRTVGGLEILIERRLKVWSLRKLFPMMVMVCPLPYFCLSSSEVPCATTDPLSHRACPARLCRGLCLSAFTRRSASIAVY
ncbi:Hypothetical_protein [Hexamita inflata]|uniref:Hypothetical_protein n=1 Tax=Hexamita inflata TaxID=28002 RepID=A0AA86U0L7_9EUKA|nr:Hypothetical protein HINF_LOCUS23281 [Hexamita inflata]